MDWTMVAHILTLVGGVTVCVVVTIGFVFEFKRNNQIEFVTRVEGMLSRLFPKIMQKEVESTEQIMNMVSEKIPEMMVNTATEFKKMMNDM